MNFSKESFASPEEILSFVTKLVDDEEYKILTKGWYVSQIQQALQALAFDTFFDERHSSLPITSLRIPMPSGAFNIRKMFLFNGTTCDIKNSQNVFWKREYFTGGSGYLASDKYNNSDPFYQNRMADGKDRRTHPVPKPGEHKAGGNLYFFNVVEGVIMLSPNCTAFQNLYISYNGIGCDYGDKPVIPRFLQQAVSYWVSDKALSIRRSKSKDAFELNKWNLVYNSNSVTLNGRNMYDGEWYKAEVRVKSMDNKTRSDLKEYFATLEP